MITRERERESRIEEDMSTIPRIISSEAISIFLLGAPTYFIPTILRYVVTLGSIFKSPVKWTCFRPMAPLAGAIITHEIASRVEPYALTR